MILVGPRLESKTLALQFPNNWKLKPEAKKRSNAGKELNAAADPRIDVALVWARKGQVAPGQSEHALCSSPWPRPFPPRAFSNLPELTTLRSPLAWEGEGWAGLTVPPG